MKICASSNEVWTHWPSPLCSRSISAIRIAWPSSRPAHKSSIGMPTRTGPWPGRPVIDISPPMPWAIWARPGRLAPGPLWPNPELYLRGEILDDERGLLRQLEVDRLPFVGLQVDGQAALVAMQVLEIEALAP